MMLRAFLVGAVASALCSFDGIPTLFRDFLAEMGTRTARSKAPDHELQSARDSLLGGWA